MAKLDILAPWILAHEGGYVNDPNDRGGATNKGVTIATWRMYGYDKNGDGKIDEKDVKLISEEDAIMVMRKNFWDTWKGNEIKSQSIANLLVDWVWASGIWGIKIPQQLLGVKDDGIVGRKTIDALNHKNVVAIFSQLKQRRKKFIMDISNRYSPKYKHNYKFQKGWLDRLDRIQYGKLVYPKWKPWFGKEVVFHE